MKVRHYSPEALDFQIRVKGLKNREIAEKTDTTRQNISAYRLGKWNPTLSQLEEICNKNNIDIRKLFKAEDEEETMPVKEAPKLEFKPEELGKAIKARGYSYTKLSKEIDLHYQTISNYCTGQTPPTISSLEKICEHINWDIRLLFKKVDGEEEIA